MDNLHCSPESECNSLFSVIKLNAAYSGFLFNANPLGELFFSCLLLHPLKKTIKKTINKTKKYEFQKSKHMFTSIFFFFFLERAHAN